MKGANSYVAIATVIFSHERSPGDSLVFISAMFVFTHIHSWRAILLSITTTVIPTYS